MSAIFGELLIDYSFARTILAVFGHVSLCLRSDSHNLTGSTYRHRQLQG